MTFKYGKMVPRYRGLWRDDPRNINSGQSSLVSLANGADVFTVSRHISRRLVCHSRAVLTNLRAGEYGTRDGWDKVRAAERFGARVCVSNWKIKIFFSYGRALIQSRWKIYERRRRIENKLLKLSYTGMDIKDPHTVNCALSFITA